MAEKKFQRKTIFIKKKIQYKFVVFILLAVLFGMSFVFYEFVSLMDAIFKNHPVLLQVFFTEGYSLLLGFTIKIFVCFSILALIAAVLSNKIAGPVYKVEMTCKRVAEGDYSARARLRDGDAGHDLADQFNKMMDVLEPKLREKSGGKDD
jgi:signal transduction histidine kinase